MLATSNLAHCAELFLGHLCSAAADSLPDTLAHMFVIVQRTNQSRMCSALRAATCTPTMHSLLLALVRHFMQLPLAMPVPLAGACLLQCLHPERCPQK